MDGQVERQRRSEKWRQRHARIMPCSRNRRSTGCAHERLRYHRRVRHSTARCSLTERFTCTRRRSSYIYIPYKHPFTVHRALLYAFAFKNRLYALPKPRVSRSNAWMPVMARPGTNSAPQPTYSQAPLSFPTIRQKDYHFFSHVHTDTL